MSQRSQDALERLEGAETVFTVYLDGGSFSWLMEIIESKQRSQAWLKPYQRLVKRTLLSFQEAQRAATNSVELPEGEPEAPRKRTIPRTPKRAARSSKR